MNAATFSRGLGWFSIALGAAELFAPRKVAEAVGISDDHDTLIRLLGAREMTSGLGLLARPKPTSWMWSRVAGDMMDLSLLGAAASKVGSRPLSVSGSRDSERRRLTTAITAVAVIGVIDLVVSMRLTQRPKIDPRWRYTPRNGRSGIARTSNGAARPPALDYPDPSALETSEQSTSRAGADSGSS
jgi:hypothetical protein